MKLLVAVDGSDLSLEAVAHALYLAGAGLQVELVLVNVQEPASFYELVTLHDKAALDALVQAAGQAVLAPAMESAREAGVPCVSAVVTGDPVAMLLEVLEEHGCGGVVMGSHGKNLVERAWVGSVSQAMLEQSPVPVTVVKSRANEVPDELA